MMDIRGYHNAMLSVQLDTFGGPGTAGDCDIWFPFNQTNHQYSCGAVRMFSITGNANFIEYGTDGKRPYRTSKGFASYRLPTDLSVMAADSDEHSLLVNFWVRQNGRVAVASAVYEVMRLYFHDTPTATQQTPLEYMQIRVGWYSTNGLYVSCQFKNRYSSALVIPFSRNTGTAAVGVWKMQTLGMYWTSSAFYIKLYDNKGKELDTSYTQITNWPQYLTWVGIGNSNYDGADLSGVRIRLPHASRNITNIMNRLYTEFN